MQWARTVGLLEHSAEEMLASRGPNASINELLHGQYLILARLFLALGKPDQALNAMAYLSENALKMGHHRRGIEYLVLKALAYQQKRQMEPALQALREALCLGEPEGFQRMFIDEGQAMAELLYQAVERGIAPAYAGKILTGFSPAELQPLEQTGERDLNAGLIEPLSEREKEVLALIIEGLSNYEIAGRLTISLSTVKGHVAHIFGKLGVANRTQAVARARGFRVLPGP
jgi:LuxR family maltose regulon positive regulatory protein